MPGCHLPLLYIGVEYIRTDNCRLGNQFICNALSIAPDDPLVLHEAGIIAYNQKEYVLIELEMEMSLTNHFYFEILQNGQCRKFFSFSIEYIKMQFQNRNNAESFRYIVQ